MFFKFIIFLYYIDLSLKFFSKKPAIHYSNRKRVIVKKKKKFLISIAKSGIDLIVTYTLCNHRSKKWRRYNPIRELTFVNFHQKFFCAVIHNKNKNNNNNNHKCVASNTHNNVEYKKFRSRKKISKITKVRGFYGRTLNSLSSILYLQNPLY